MNIFKKIIIGYVFYTFPLTLLLFICGAIKTPNMVFPPPDMYSTLMIFLVFQSGVWSLISLGLTVSMFFSKNLRNTVLVKLSGMKERDEREVQIVGKALKSSYLTSMTILLCLFSISFIQITGSKKSSDNLAPGEFPRSISLGFHAELIDSDAVAFKKDGYDIFFQYNDVPFSTSSLIMFLLIWQIASYRYVSRKALRLPECTDSDG